MSVKIQIGKYEWDMQYHSFKKEWSSSNPLGDRWLLSDEKAPLNSVICVCGELFYADSYGLRMRRFHDITTTRWMPVNKDLDPAKFLKKAVLE